MNHVSLGGRILYVPPKLEVVRKKDGTTIPRFRFRVAVERNSRKVAVHVTALGRLAEEASRARKNQFVWLSRQH